MVEATPEMASYCCAVIHSNLKNELPPKVPQSIPNDPCPIFVCLKTLDGQLRGCIGTFNAEPLHNQLKDYAIAASTKDRRFSPVKLSELPSLQCSVCLLHSFEEAKDWKDWVIGVHGIRIKYRKYDGTFLPSVMPEQGWDHRQTLNRLLKKAGYNGDVTESVLNEVILTRYQESEAGVKFASLGFQA